MILYRIQYQCPDDGTRVEWAGSRRLAGRILRERLAELRERFGDEDWCDEEIGEPSGIERVDIPTDRVGLLGWLNRELTSDNG